MPTPGPEPDTNEIGQHAGDNPPEVGALNVGPNVPQVQTTQGVNNKKGANSSAQPKSPTFEHENIVPS